MLKTIFLSTLIALMPAYSSGGVDNKSEEKPGILAEEFVLSRLHRQNKIQMQAGEIVGSEGQDREVRKFARKVAASHRRIDHWLVTIAKNQNLKIEPVTPQSAQEKELFQSQDQNLERLIAIQRHRIKEEGVPSSRIFLKNTIDNYEILIPMLRDAGSRMVNNQVKALIKKALLISTANQQQARRLFDSLEERLQLPTGELEKKPTTQ